MIKKFILFLGITASVAATAQCTISGKSTINVLSEETYSIPTETAQCRDCHLWVTVGGNAMILNDNRQNIVKIKANAGGREVLSLSVLTPQGLMQCSKNIDIVDSNGSIMVNSDPQRPKGNCDIEVNNYKEVKYAQGIASFFPNVSNDAYKYSWTATYNNGETMTSTDKVPQFPYTKENGISKVNVRINSPKCMKEFSKTYDANYWKFF